MASRRNSTLCFKIPPCKQISQLIAIASYVDICTLFRGQLWTFEVNEAKRSGQTNRMATLPTLLALCNCRSWSIYSLRANGCIRHIDECVNGADGNKRIDGEMKGSPFDKIVYCFNFAYTFSFITNITPVVLIIHWSQRCGKPFCGPMLVLSIDAFMRHSVSMN